MGRSVFLMVVGFVAGFLMRGMFPAVIRVPAPADWRRLVRGSSCPARCVSVAEEGEKQLVGVVVVRIRRNAGWEGTVELVQHIQYLLLAGCHRVLLYDTYSAPWERQLLPLRPLIQSGRLIYVDWSSKNPHTIPHQLQAYEEAMARFPNAYVITFDMDEYPVVPRDTRPGFLLREINRQVASFRAAQKKLAVILLANIGFVGPFDHSKELLIDRIHNSTIFPMNAFTKPIYVDQEGVAKLHLHKPSVKDGYEVLKEPQTVYLAHFWGTRWNEKTAGRLFGKTRENTDLFGMRDVMLECKAMCKEDFYLVTKPFWDEDNQDTKSICYRNEFDKRIKPQACLSKKAQYN